MAITDIGSSISQPSRQLLSRLFLRGATKPTMPPRAPAHWRKTEFETSSPHNKLYIAPAAHERARVIYISGLNSSPTFFADEIVPLQKTGISVYGYPLPNTDEAEGDLINYLKTPVKDLLFNPDGEIYKTLKSNVPVYVVTHSTGGLLFADFTVDPQKREFLEESKIRGAVHLAPFFDIANASKIFNPLANISYTGYSVLCSRIRSGRLPTDKVYYYFTGIEPSGGEDSSSYTDPFHQQIRQLSRYGRNVVKQMIELDADNDYMPIAMPQTFITGEHDPIASHRTAGLVAELQCAELLQLDCKHNPVRQQFITAMHRIHNNISRCATGLGDIQSSIEQHYRGSAPIISSI